MKMINIGFFNKSQRNNIIKKGKNYVFSELCHFILDDVYYFHILFRFNILDNFLSQSLFLYYDYKKEGHY